MLPGRGATQDTRYTRGARLVIVNAEATPFDPLADAVVREQLGEVLPALAAALGLTRRTGAAAPTADRKPRCWESRPFG